MTKSPTLSDEDIINLIDCAGYGIGYWAPRAELNKTAKTYRVIGSREDLAAGEARLDKTVSYNEIRQAFATLAKTGLLPDWQMREIADNELAFDSMVGDMTIQQAVFGEIIYG